jgi:hypothetical protein
MRRRVLLIPTIFLISLLPLLGDDAIRRAQEELRKRNLYFGEVDGRSNEELSGALKRYQARKGLQVTGEIDEETANSLNIRFAASKKGGEERWPDLPILKSDVARSLSDVQRRALEKHVEVNLDSATSPLPPAEPPSSEGKFTPEQVTRLVEDYLRDAETKDVDRQVRYYSFPTEYFDHGSVNRDFVFKDTQTYIKRWPYRKYVLTGPVHFSVTGKDSEMEMEFSIVFSVRNEKNSVKGKTKNFWTVKPEANELKIVKIREERLRE